MLGIRQLTLNPEVIEMITDACLGVFGSANIIFKFCGGGVEALSGEVRLGNCCSRPHNMQPTYCVCTLCVLLVNTTL